MKSNQPHTITIEQFHNTSVGMGAYYGADLLVSSGVPDLDLFRTPTRIDALTVLVCTGGDIDLTINLRPYHLECDNVLINFPEDILHLQDSHNLSAFAILFSPSFLNMLQIEVSQRLDLYADFRRSTVTAIPHDRTEILQSYYTLMRDAIGENNPVAADVLRGLGSAFCSQILSMRMRFGIDAHGFDSVSGGRGARMFNRFMAILQRYHTRERSLGFYADRLCVTPNYLSCTVKEQTGRTAAQWIDDYVVLEAQIMLRTSDLSIQQIADRLNFSTQSALGKYFKQQTGMSPRRYRNSK